MSKKRTVKSIRDKAREAYFNGKITRDDFEHILIVTRTFALTDFFEPIAPVTKVIVSIIENTSCYELEAKI